MWKFLAGVIVGWLMYRSAQIIAEDRRFAQEWDAFAAGVEARRATFG